jgi:hypothetical protein
VVASGQGAHRSSDSPIRDGLARPDELVVHPRRAVAAPAILPKRYLSILCRLARRHSGGPRPLTDRVAGTFRLPKLHGSLSWHWAPDDTTGVKLQRWRSPGGVGADVPPGAPLAGWGPAQRPPRRLLRLAMVDLAAAMPAMTCAGPEGGKIRGLRRVEEAMPSWWWVQWGVGDRFASAPRASTSANRGPRCPAVALL